MALGSAPQHTCMTCPACFFDLGRLANTLKPAKYVWMVIGLNDSCDIRRYEFTHEGAVNQLAHTKSFKDSTGKGEWVLYKLVRVNRRKRK